MARSPRSTLALKLVLAVAAIGAFGYLFVSSLETTRSEPYTVTRAHLGNWRLVLEPAHGPDAPLLALRAGTGLVSNLSRQLFQRAMESMATPQQSSIPVVLHGEYERGLAPRMTRDQLLAAAREAGLESASHEPRCLAQRRISEPGATRQVYFAVVDSPSIVAFREQLARSAEDGFGAAAQTPILLVSASDATFHRWLPIRAEESECLAPIEIR